MMTERLVRFVIAGIIGKIRSVRLTVARENIGTVPAACVGPNITKYAVRLAPYPEDWEPNVAANMPRAVVSREQAGTVVIVFVTAVINIAVTVPEKYPIRSMSVAANIRFADAKPDIIGLMERAKSTAQICAMWGIFFIATRRAVLVTTPAKPLSV